MLHALIIVALSLYTILASENPCFDRSWTVPDCTPDMPNGLCAACPLDTDNVQGPGDSKPGHFDDCNQLFKIDSEWCRMKMLEFVVRTPCDERTKQAYMDYYMQKDTSCTPDDRDSSCAYNKIARATLERVVYTNCELCCDTIGCGNVQELRETTKPHPLDINRRNGPEHVYWDNCKHYPDQLVDGERVCDLANEWKQVGRGKMDYKNTPQLTPLIQTMLHMYGCNRTNVWMPCLDLEEKQGRLNVGHENC